MAVSTTTVAGDIPSVLEPYYLGTESKEGLLPLATQAIFPSGLTGQEAYESTYAPLIESGLVGAGTVAGMSPGQQQLGQDIAGLGLPSIYGQAGEAAGLAASGYQGVPGVSAPELSQYQLAGPQMFGSDQAQQYMSPYMQSVVDIQQRKAVDAARQAQLGTNLGAARQGTYGGARQALLQGQRESGLRSQMGDIQATGLQSAFENAQQQFERDRAAQMGTERANLEAALGVQQLGAGQSMEAQRANQQAQLTASQGLGSLAQTMGALGTQQLAGELDILKTQGAYGDLERAIAQQQLDAERQYLSDQANYGLTQVGNLSNILRGVPLSDQTQTQMTPPPSFASQLTGLGLTGIGLYNLLGSKP